MTPAEKLAVKTAKGWIEQHEANLREAWSAADREKILEQAETLRTLVEALENAEQRLTKAEATGIRKAADRLRLMLNGGGHGKGLVWGLLDWAEEIDPQAEPVPDAPYPTKKDPKPYVTPNTGVRYEVGGLSFGKEPPRFLPRPEYEQDIARYEGAHLHLDPKPWAYALLGETDKEKAAREAEQVTGGFAFAPRDGYEQDRKRYPS